MPPVGITDVDLHPVVQRLWVGFVGLLTFGIIRCHELAHVDPGGGIVHTAVSQRGCWCDSTHQTEGQGSGGKGCRQGFHYFSISLRIT